MSAPQEPATSLEDVCSTVSDLCDRLRDLGFTLSTTSGVTDGISSYSWRLMGQARGSLHALRQSLGRDIDAVKGLSPARSDIASLRIERKLLAAALGKVLVHHGIIRPDAELTGPELLLAAETAVLPSNEDDAPEVV